MTEESNEGAMDAARAALKEHFGYDGFRPGQETLVGAVLSGRDCLGVMPTGAGKSICYQIPGVVLPGLTLVVSPLVSLMGDQVRALLDAGVRGSYLNSTLTPGQQGTVMRRALAGAYDIMYVAPERLADSRFIEFASQANIPLIAIDEAHCVSQWGQDFRPAYLGIGEFIDALPKRPIVAALTATATEKVREDIVSLLGLRNPATVVTGFDRPNLHFAVEQLPSKRKLARIVAYALNHPQDSGIVYCSTRKDVEKVHETLVEAGVQAVRYHAGLWFKSAPILSGRLCWTMHPLWWLPMRLAWALTNRMCATLSITICQVRWRRITRKRVVLVVTASRRNACCCGTTAISARVDFSSSKKLKTKPLRLKSANWYAPRSVACWQP